MSVKKNTLLLITCLAASFSGYSQTTTVPNLAAIPNALTTPEAKQSFAEQIAGVPSTNEFGTLPQGLDIPTWLDWIAPNEDTSLLTLTGAKPWGKDGLYVSVACFAYDPEDAKSAKKERDTDCSEDFQRQHVKKLYLGVFRWQDNKMQPIARSVEPLDRISLWNKLDPEAMISSDMNRPLAYYKKLDLAPYRIAPDVMAFGVRGGFSEGYSGGGAEYEVLELYMMVGDKLVNVLSELVFAYENIAGNWNSDGTREHDITETKFILKILPSKTDGFYDLQFQEVDGGSHVKLTFIWSAQQRHYIPQI